MMSQCDSLTVTHTDTESRRLTHLKFYQSLIKFVVWPTMTAAALVRPWKPDSLVSCGVPSQLWQVHTMMWRVHWIPTTGPLFEELRKDVILCSKHMWRVHWIPTTGPQGLLQSMTSFLSSSSSIRDTGKTVLRISHSSFRTYLTRASHDMSFMFVVYYSSIRLYGPLGKVWFVFRTQTTLWHGVGLGSSWIVLVIFLNDSRDSTLFIFLYISFA
jgi:hypothetical protein